MAPARRRAEVGWKGTLEEGRGSCTVGNWMWGEAPVIWFLAHEPRGAYRRGPRELLSPGPLDGSERTRLAARERRGRGRLHPERGRIPQRCEHAHHLRPVCNALKGNVEIGVNTTRAEG